MKEIGVAEFVRRLHRLLDRDSQLAFFLGAGASISSGIPGAAALTTRWLRELYDTEDASAPFEEWPGAGCPEFDPGNPAASYSAVMRRLFHTQAERQREIETVVVGHDPGFAYATLAQLLAHETYGPRCNVVLTTNFDDLVADALYLFTRIRPLVVTHESLVAYAEVGRSRPTVIKLHGDALLQPRNTEDELGTLAREFVLALQSHLRSRALIVIGYGGNDAGVFGALSSLSPDTVNHGIYWVNDRLPDNDFGRWLWSHPDSVWVRHLDFDELMAVVKVEFDLPNPDDRRFTDLLGRYRDTFSELQKKVRGTEHPSPVVAASVEEVRQRWGNWFSVELEAQKYKGTDPVRAAEIYETGIVQFPNDPRLLGDYANLLTDVLGEHDRAEELYEQAMAADNADSTNLSNYANFLSEIRRQHGRAQEIYAALVAGDPNPLQVTNYAGVLYAAGRTQLAREIADRARSHPGFNDLPTYNLQLAFYELANDEPLSDQRRHAIEVVRRRLIAGTRAMEWRAGSNIDTARASGRPDSEIEFLVALEQVIADRAPLESLDRFPEWRQQES